MYGSQPTTRLLSMMELLQARGRIGVPELARRLEVGERTVRRYAAMLREMGCRSRPRSDATEATGCGLVAGCRRCCSPRRKLRVWRWACWSAWITPS